MMMLPLLMPMIRCHFRYAMITIVISATMIFFRFRMPLIIIIYDELLPYQ